MSGGATAGSGWTNLINIQTLTKARASRWVNAAVQDTGNQFASDKSTIDHWSKGLQDQIGAQKQADTAQAQQFSGQAANAGTNFGQAAQQQSFDNWRKATENKPKQFEEQEGYQDAYVPNLRLKTT